MSTMNITEQERNKGTAVSKIVAGVLEEGLTKNKGEWVISAIDHLLSHKDNDLIIEILDKAYQNKLIAKNDSLIKLIGKSLHDSAKEVDPLLYKYGDSLLHRSEFIGPSEWKHKKHIK